MSRITNTLWQTIAGIGPSRSEGKPGTVPVDERGKTGNCEFCGKAMYAHDKERVYTENGRYHYAYVCP